MRKIWINIPLSRHILSNEVFHYISKVNEKCSDIDKVILAMLSKKYLGELIYINDTYKFYIGETLICIVKQIEVDLQGFPEKPNATIHY